MGGLLLPSVGKQRGRDRKGRAVPWRDLTVTAPGRAEVRESGGAAGVEARCHCVLLSKKTKTNLSQTLRKIMRER